MSIDKQSLDAKANIQRWLFEDGYKLQETPDLKARFNFLVEAPDGHQLHAVQPNDSTDKLLLVASVAMSPDQEAKMMRLDASTRKELFWDMRFNLLDMGLPFNINQMPFRVVVNNIVYFDELTKGVLMRAVLDVQRGIMAVMWTIERAMEEESSEETPYIG